MGTTTNYKLPYPESLDRVKMGWKNFRDLATAVDVELKKLSDAVQPGSSAAQPVSSFDLAPLRAENWIASSIKLYYNASTATLLIQGLKNNGGASPWLIPNGTIPAKLRPPNWVPFLVFSGNATGTMYATDNGGLTANGFAQNKLYSGSTSWAI
ncbi:hypothetical protein [Corynebacterium striatum]|uniref:hypothetical protein n=1 Tax=Corynebacterium striatum TaxID=43770 RepID=UPI0034D556C0